jgi:coenzyme PQQ synthesis protein D (PqqD)
MDRAYRIEAASVVSDVIDGEAVMLHRGSGDYFSTDGVGSLIWQWIEEGRSRGRMLGDLEARFAADPAVIAAALDSFIVDLLSHQLVREASATVEPEEARAAAGPVERVPFCPPVLNIYSDIRNLLLLDPIHDVAEESGWPVPKQGGTPP